MRARYGHKDSSPVLGYSPVKKQNHIWRAGNVARLVLAIIGVLLVFSWIHSSKSEQAIRNAVLPQPAYQIWASDPPYWESYNGEFLYGSDVLLKTKLSPHNRQYLFEAKELTFANYSVPVDCSRSTMAISKSTLFGELYIAYIEQCSRGVIVGESGISTSYNQPALLGSPVVSLMSPSSVAIIVPFAGEADKLIYFLTQVGGVFDTFPGSFTKTIVVGCGSLKHIDEGAQCTERSDLMSKVDEVNDLFTSVSIKIADAGVFTRSHARNTAINELSDDTIVLTIDLDCVIQHDYILRALAFAQPGVSVYFPMVFSTFNPESIKYSRFTHVVSNSDNPFFIHPETGQFRIWGFGMMAAAVSDVKAVGLYNEDHTSWGLEDNEMYDSFKRSKLKLWKVYDPDIVHRYHPKSCEGNKGDESKYAICLSTVAVYEGTVYQLERRREHELPDSKSVISGQ